MHLNSTVSSRPISDYVPVQTDPDELVRTHCNLVHRLARQTFMRFSSAIPVEDLIQIGQIALIQAARAFEDRGEATFNTYATTRVRGAMIDMLRKSATITRESMRRRREFANARQSLQGLLGRPPTDAEMAARVNMAVGSYRSAHAATHSAQHTSIDDSYSDHNSQFADESPDAFALLDSARQRASLADAIKTLPEREQIILQLYFVDECSLEDIGRIFNVGPARICQIKKSGLGKLREILNGSAEMT